MLSALRNAPSVVRSQGFAVFVQGESSLGLWMLESGHVDISRVSGRGKEVVLEVLESGDLIGLGAAVSGYPHETGAETVDDCRLHLLPRADFLKLMRTDAESSAAVASLLATELSAAHRWIGNTALARSTAARLAKFLLNSPRSELAAITHHELAQRIGVSREAVSRILASFRTSGAISPVPGQIALRDRLILQRIAS
jgi:CRP/FNR family transcriptional regulator